MWDPGLRRPQKFQDCDWHRGKMQCLIFIECVEFSRDDKYVLLITVTAQWAWWRLKSPASRLFTQPFVQVQTKENIKVPCHWPLWGEFPGQRASNTENVPIWWRPLSSSKYKRSTALLLIRNNIISYAIKSGTAQVTLYRSVLPMFTMFPIFHDHDRTIIVVFCSRSLAPHAAHDHQYDRSVTVARMNHDIGYDFRIN